MAIIGRDLDGAFLKGSFDKSQPDVRREWDAFGEEVYRIATERQYPHVLMLRWTEDRTLFVSTYVAVDPPADADLQVGSAAEAAAVGARLAADAAKFSGAKGTDAVADAIANAAPAKDAADEFDAL